MPKKKSKRKSNSAQNEDQLFESRSSLRARLVKWASISIILALVLSLLAAAVSVSPASASTAPYTASESPTPCQPIDTDGDAITNEVDSDIDGDETVNGLDDDIDGDGIPNSEDGDPAATNCGADANPPVILPSPENSPTSADSSWIAIVGVALLGLGYLVLRRVRASKK